MNMDQSGDMRSRYSHSSEIVETSVGYCQKRVTRMLSFELLKVIALKFT